MIAGSKKILLVLPAQGGSRALGENVAFALNALSHKVTLFDVLEQKKALDNNLGSVNQALISETKKTKPDIVLVIALAPVALSTLRSIKALNIPTVHYFCEDLRAEEHWRPIIADYDHFFIIQNEAWLTKCRELNRSTYYLPNGAPIEYLPESSLEKKYDLVFAGAPYENRINFFERLIRTSLDFHIFGWGWDRVSLSTALRNRVVGTGKWLNYKELFKIYSESKIVLNLHSTLTGHEIETNGDFVNPRSFAIPLAHSLQLSDRRDALFEFFSEGMDIACFASIEELVQKADYYLAHPDSLSSIIEESRSTVLSKHLLTHRMEQLIEAVFSKEKHDTFSDCFLEIKNKFKAGQPMDDNDMLILLAEDIRTKHASSEKR
jgi:spore maturation protein CgeB